MNKKKKLVEKYERSSLFFRKVIFLSVAVIFLEVWVASSIDYDEQVVNEQNSQSLKSMFYQTSKTTIELRIKLNYTEDASNDAEMNSESSISYQELDDYHNMGESEDDDDEQSERPHYVSSKDKMVDKVTAEMFCDFIGIPLVRMQYEESVELPPLDIDAYLSEKRSELYWTDHNNKTGPFECVAMNLYPLRKNASEESILMFLPCDKKLRFICL